ncbi:hypothetical protein EXS74_01130 [Candidatus Woesearchaeota archaeon]|nr:hypothetical protein [Candidatus Woesearchaeota archaeon]
MFVQLSIAVKHNETLGRKEFINLCSFTKRMKDVLKEITPTRKEQQEVNNIVKHITKSIHIPYTKITLGGSSAKGTWLKNNHDIDLYIKFNPEKYEGIDIAEVLKDNIKDATVLHGSRDYLQKKEGKYTIELIPIMDIKNVEHAQNITDISPFHAKWVNKHKKYRKDILLAKAFAKANGFYGAESFIKGFSGYSIEVLTIHYKGFKSLLKNVAEWKQTTTIDTEKHHKKKVQLNQAKMLSPLILVDPVQSTRNVTAVVSQEKYDLFKKKGKEYLRSPKKEMFVKKEFSLEEIQKKKGEKIILKLVPLEGKRDVVGAKLLKCFEYMRDQLKEHEFEIKEANWHWKEGENATLYYFFKDKKLSQTIKHYGPPISEKERLSNFKQIWKQYPLKNENGKSYVILPRKYSSPKELVSHLLDSEIIKSRVKEISINR